LAVSRETLRDDAEAHRVPQQQGQTKASGRELVPAGHDDRIHDRLGHAPTTGTNRWKSTKGGLAGQVPATHPQLGQSVLIGKGISLPQAPHLAQAKLPGQSLPAHAVSLWRIVTYDVQGRNRGGKRNQFPAGGNGLWRASPTTAVVVQKELKVYFNLPDACPVPVKGVFSKLVRALLC
jgi:hypothetical protein